jgi:squalene-hopene/tetraprenyl-beta-curcumene cyclase
VPPDALSGAVDWLLARQAPEGWWSGELESNVTMTAEHVLLHRFLGLDLEPMRAGAIAHFLRQQRADGSWALYYQGPADLSTTIETYVALKLLGVDPASAPMRSALSIIRRLGGVARARVFTKIWLAIFGKYPWSGVPTMPPELVFLPSRAPLNLYNFACWARGTIAPLLIVLTRRPVRPLGIDVSELILRGTEKNLERVPGSGPWWWLDQLLKLYERFPIHPGRGVARRRLVDWIVAHQEADGSWGGIQPPWVYSLIALSLEGMAVDHPVMRKGLQGMGRFTRDDGVGLRFEACQSPVWDTAWVLRALQRAGFSAAESPIRRSIDWILGEQIQGGGDWQVRCALDDSAGWAFEFDNDLYPDIDDTAVVAVALLECAPADPRVAAAVERATRWLLAMRSSNGAWAAFDRDNTDELVYRLPFADFGALIDPPSEDVTAHVLELLATLPGQRQNPVIAPALEYLRRQQRAAGSWFGRWGVNHIYGTWCVVSALVPLAAGRDMVRAAADWMISRQNPDGGWGETCYSYEDESFAGIGASTASQTAWAVMTLQLAGLAQHAATQRGLSFLCERQVDGTWNEPEYTGTGFPRDFYINYHLYRHVFPTMALAQARQRWRPTPEAIISAGRQATLTR